MTLAPLYDYLSLLNGRYGLAIAAVPVFFSVLARIFSRAGERSPILGLLVTAATIAVLFLYAGFLIFIFCKSYSGVRYEFWQLTCSIFIAVFTFSCACLLNQSLDDGFREARIFLILALVASLIFSPMVVGMLRLFERFHPLWP